MREEEERERGERGGKEEKEGEKERREEAEGNAGTTEWNALKVDPRFESSVLGRERGEKRRERSTYLYRSGRASVGLQLTPEICRPCQPKSEVEIASSSPACHYSFPSLFSSSYVRMAAPITLMPQ